MYQTTTILSAQLMNISTEAGCTAVPYQTTTIISFQLMIYSTEAGCTAVPYVLNNNNICLVDD